MYGLAFELLEKCVIEQHGLDTWHAIKKIAKCEVEDQGFLSRIYYPDQLLVSLAEAASKHLGTTVHDVIEGLGNYWVHWMCASGLEDMMKSQGDTLRTWLSNLNAMHDHVQRSFQGDKFLAPIFWCEDEDNTGGSILLHYYSFRGTLMRPLATGIIKELAVVRFEFEINMEVVDVQGKNGSKYSTWRITAKDPSQRHKLSNAIESKKDVELQVPSGIKNDEAISSVYHLPSNDSGEDSAEQQNFATIAMPSKCPFTGLILSEERHNHTTMDCATSETPPGMKCPFSGQHLSVVNDYKQSKCPYSESSTKALPSIDTQVMSSLFPFHVIVDHGFHIRHVGDSLPKTLKKASADLIGTHIGDLLEITRPVLECSWDWNALRKFVDQNLFLAPKRVASLKKRVSMEDAQVKFRSTMIDLKNGQIMFTLTPEARNVRELSKMGLKLCDLPLHSGHRDTFFVGEYIMREVNSAQNLDQLSKVLEIEKNMSNTLLYNMMPKNVADRLRSGKTVEPKHYENVTLFFSDIEGFTAICNKVDPWEVIDLLNKLYSLMDYLAAKFNLYKVETIGDAYMCCSGLPYSDDMHAENIANFAIAVTECVKHITSPADGVPIKLRIGIHTGSCTAGVVGSLTPRYCLFGDMVNATARHEQTSMSGKIHCSSELFGRLKHFSKSGKELFKFAPRGLIDMKGKGQRYTYWLEGGSKDNEIVNENALEALSAEVALKLRTEWWKVKQYFGQTDSPKPDGFEIAATTTEQRCSPLSKGADRSSSSSSEGETGSTCCSSDDSISGNLQSCEMRESADDGDECFLMGSSMSNMANHTERSLSELEEEDAMAVVQCWDANKKMSHFEWRNDLSQEEGVADVHNLLSPMLHLCLHGDTTNSGPDNLDQLDSQLFGFINRMSRIHPHDSCFYNFNRIANIARWADFMLDNAQRGSLLDASPWYRFALATSALILHCNRIGIDQHQGVTSNVVAKIAVQYGLDIMAEEFPQLYDEIIWAFPSFLHLVKRSVMLALLPLLEAKAIFDDCMDAIGNDQRSAVKRTETSMGLILSLANFGYCAQDYDTFLTCNTAKWEETTLKGRGKKLEWWFDEEMEFIDAYVLPVAKICFGLLNCDCDVTRAMMTNIERAKAEITSRESRALKSHFK